MPRIRKKTSKRGTTNQREKIKHKVRESRKKAKKEAKKNPQWKTRHPKDPGIPNNFPYKDQILAEIAESRAKLEEEKARRKETKKASKLQAQSVEDAAGSGGEESANEFDGIGAVPVSTRLVSGSSSSKKRAALDVEVEEDQAPPLLNPDLSTFDAVLNQADVVLHVVDAQDPLGYLSSSLEKAVKQKEKKLAVILNKIDLCPRESVSAWASELRKQCETFLFRSSSAFLPQESTYPGKGKAKLPTDNAVGAHSLLAFLSKLAQEKDAGAPFTVAVAGIANSGKSSLVNSLARKSAVPIYQPPSLNKPVQGASTTEYPIEVSVDISGNKIRFIDTPALSFTAESEADTEATRARDILVRNRGRIDRLKDVSPPVAEIVSRANVQDLMLFYNLPVFARNDTEAFLTALARSRQLLTKHGAPDLTSAARVVLRDWNTGAFARYTAPAASTGASEASPSSGQSELYDRDEQILATLRTRKELRKDGAVRLTPSARESRAVVLDASWIRSASGDDEESIEGDVIEDDGTDASEDADADEVAESSDEDDEDEDEDEDESDDAEEDEEPLPPIASKRKRRDSQPTGPPVSKKKVSFAAKTKGPASPSQKQIVTAKSALKTSASKSATKPSVRPKSGPLKKIGNAPTAKTKKSATGSSDAYDFNQFF